MNKDLLYWIPAGQYGKEGVLSLLAQHPEIRFVSLIGIDLAGNDTDEKIPIEIFMKDYDDFFAGVFPVFLYTMTNLLILVLF